MPITARMEYLRFLTRVIKQINADVEQTVIPAYDRSYIADSVLTNILKIFDRIRFAWGGSAFKRKAQGAAYRFATSTIKQTARKFGIDAYNTPKMQSYVKDCVAMNVSLITSITEQHLSAVQNIVLSNVEAGLEASAIVEQIQSYGVTLARAKLIAYDQTTKILGQVNKIQQEEAGFKYFRWLTSKDERVRDYHREFQDRITPYGKGVYRWDELPEYKGRKLYPSWDYRCRCVAIPVAEWEVREWQMKHKQGKK